MPNMAPRLPFENLRISARIAANPPKASINALMEATRIVTIMVSNIPDVPVPMAENAVA